MSRLTLQGLMFVGLLTSCGPGASREASTVQEIAGYGRPTVFARGDGEKRMMRGTRPLFILADSVTVGSRTLMAGYEEVAPGDSGRVHMDLEHDEIIFVHRGALHVLLGDRTHQAAAGATVFIPRRTWVTFRTAGVDTAGFFFVFNAPGFEKCLRVLSTPPDERFVAPSPMTIERASRGCHYLLRAS